jgi:hypothetical protein
VRENGDKLGKLTQEGPIKSGVYLQNDRIRDGFEAYFQAAVRVIKKL